MITMPKRMSGDFIAMFERTKISLETQKAIRTRKEADEIIERELNSKTPNQAKIDGAKAYLRTMGNLYHKENIPMDLKKLLDGQPKKDFFENSGIPTKTYKGKEPLLARYKEGSLKTK